MFDTVAIEPQGRIQDSMLGGGGGVQYLKHEIFICERRRREAMLGRGGGGGGPYELGTLSHTEIIPTYTQGCSNEFES